MDITQSVTVKQLATCLISRRFHLILGSLAFSSAAFAASGKVTPPHRVKAFLGLRLETYQDESHDEAQNKTSTQSDIKTTGFQLIAGTTLKAWELEIDYRNLTPKDTGHWQSSSYTFVNFTRYFNRWKFISPMFGYMMLNQTGDQTEASAPAVFADKVTSLAIGAHLNGIPLAFKKKHEILFQARVHYLTAFQSGKNTGLDYQAGLGYGYLKAKNHLGIVFHATGNSYDAKLPDENDSEKTRSVKSSYSGLGILFYYQR
jgi:hypothetical protein